MAELKRLRTVLNWLIFKEFAENDADLAKKLGYTKSSFSQIINGRVPLSEKFINNLGQADSNINIVWIMTGEGTMLKSNFENQVLEDTVDGNNKIGFSNEYRLVPLINVDAVGGLHKSNEITVSDTEYIIRMIAFNDARDGDKCIQVTSNSMNPTCPPGSLVLIREVAEWKEYFGFGSIFVLLLKDGRRIIKEITKYNENPKDYVLCVSHNKSVPAEELPKNMIVNVWKVVKILTNRGW